MPTILEILNDVNIKFRTHAEVAQAYQVSICTVGGLVKSAKKSPDFLTALEEKRAMKIQIPKAVFNAV